MRLFLVTALLFARAAFALDGGSSCDSPLDLREAGGALHGLENVTQGYEKTNLCGFYAFSQYLDSWRISRLAERGVSMNRASAVAIGVDHAITKNLPYWMPIQSSTDALSLRLGRWGSTFCSLAKAVEDEGYCVDPSLPVRNVDETAKLADVTTWIYGRLFAIAEAPGYRRAEAIERELPAVYERYSKWAMDRGNAVIPLAEVRAWIEREPTKPYRTIRSMFFPVCAKSESRNRDFAFKACRGELYVGLDVSGIPTPEQDPLRTERASRRVHELLNRENPTPVPFTYCSSVLREGKKYDGASPIGKGCGIHWSLIAGRKKIGGECHLLVRNSWKPSAHYSSDWIVEGGDLWVREKELMRAALLVEWLD